MLDFYCIYKQDSATCNSLLSKCIESAKEFYYYVIPYPGIYGDDIDTLAAKENITVCKDLLHKVRSKGVIGCFLSHYFLWKKCIDLNTPIGVLEYDAAFLNALPNNILDSFKDYCNLDITRHKYFKKGKDVYSSKLNKADNITVELLIENLAVNENSFLEYVNKNHISGAHGYIIKPSGAKKLLDFVKIYGMMPADIHINLKACNMSYTSESIVHLHSVTSFKAKFSHTKNSVIRNL
jgi:GR25 family glycosyltransferase involved in LPS biosynthesis